MDAKKANKTKRKPRKTIKNDESQPESLFCFIIEDASKMPCEDPLEVPPTPKRKRMSTPTRTSCDPVPGPSTSDSEVDAKLLDPLFLNSLLSSPVPTASEYLELQWSAASSPTKSIAGCRRTLNYGSDDDEESGDEELEPPYGGVGQRVLPVVTVDGSGDSAPLVAYAVPDYAPPVYVKYDTDVCPSTEDVATTVAPAIDFEFTTPAVPTNSVANASPAASKTNVADTKPAVSATNATPVSPATKVADPTPAAPAIHVTKSKMGADRPRGLFHFDWEPFPATPIPPESRRERISQINVGPTTPMTDPYDIFVAIWDREIMEHIASETNRYAQQLVEQMIHDNKLRPQSRITAWQDTTADELYLYMAIDLAMGLVVKTKVEEYWSTACSLTATPGFSAHMTYARFMLLTKCLHFVNNKEMCAQELPEAKLFKIQPILSHLNRKFKSMYNPSQNISLDESLLMWKGCLNINQLIRNKAATVGIKTYEVCESQTGYLWRFAVHAHKSSSQQRQSEDPLSAFTPDIVLTLLRGLEHRGHTVWMDSFYNSPILARRLKTLGFDCVGTLRTNRKFVPQVLHNLANGNMLPGQLTGLTSGDVDIILWKDASRAVALISTYHGVAVDQAAAKPIVISDYNIMMGGVDKKDQMLAMYPMERKRTKVWYKKLFRRLLNVSVLNSYVIHTKSSTGNTLTHRNFRIKLTQSLLSRHGSTPPTREPVVHLNHFIEWNPMPPGSNERRRRMCAVCKKRSKFHCPKCDKGICVGSCFLTLHEMSSSITSESPKETLKSPVETLKSSAVTLPIITLRKPKK